ncbi:transcriptional regulator [Sulfurimonas sp. MAG313]|nr:P-II family nitrogen regulator [Sulfurimonas sp. MAG313]MDF1881185.1 transcriptional regulator [Sulfurimonas sp. MAG313]
MTFTTVIAIVAEEHEDSAIDIAKANGAGGVTILKGRGLGLGDKSTFFGLSYERSDSVLIFVMEKTTALKVIDAVSSELELVKPGNGLIFSLPIENLAGIPQKQIRRFEENLNS